MGFMFYCSVNTELKTQNTKPQKQQLFMRIAVIHHISAVENDYGFYISDLLSEYATWLGYDVQLLEDFLFKNKKSLPENAIIGINVKAESSFGLRWWYSSRLPSILAQVKADVVVNLNGICNAAVKQPQVLAFSDVTFLENNALATTPWKKLVTKNIVSYARNASSVFTYSQHACGVIEKITGETKGSIHTIPYCTDKLYRVWEWHEKVLTKSEFTDSKEFFVAILDDKNEESWLTVLKAFSKFKKWQQSSMQFILLPKHEIAPLKVIDKMSTYKYKDDVQMLDGLSEKEKASLLGCAYAIIHLPANDADLMPVAEALQCATPIITSSGSVSLKEYGDNTGLSIANNDFELLGDAIINLFKNEELKTQMAENAKLQAAEVKRDEIAKSFWEIIESVVKK